MTIFLHPINNTCPPFEIVYKPTVPIGSCSQCTLHAVPPSRTACAATQKILWVMNGSRCCSARREEPGCPRLGCTYSDRSGQAAGWIWLLAPCHYPCYTYYHSQPPGLQSDRAELVSCQYGNIQDIYHRLLEKTDITPDKATARRVLCYPKRTWFWAQRCRGNHQDNLFNGEVWSTKKALATDQRLRAWPAIWVADSRSGVQELMSFHTSCLGDEINPSNLCLSTKQSVSGFVSVCWSRC